MQSYCILIYLRCLYFALSTLLYCFAFLPLEQFGLLIGRFTRLYHDVRPTDIQNLIIIDYDCSNFNRIWSVTGSALYCSSLVRIIRNSFVMCKNVSPNNVLLIHRVICLGCIALILGLRKSVLLCGKEMTARKQICLFWRSVEW